MGILLVVGRDFIVILKIYKVCDSFTTRLNQPWNFDAR